MMKEGAPRIGRNAVDATVDYILVLVKDAPLQLLSSRIAELVALAESRGAVILSIDFSLVTLDFGVLPGATDNTTAADSRRKLVTDLSTMLGADIAILHGQRPGVVGSFGSDTRQSWTAAVSGYRDLLARLAATEFGDVTEL